MEFETYSCSHRYRIVGQEKMPQGHAVIRRVRCSICGHEITAGPAS